MVKFSSLSATPYLTNATVVCWLILGPPMPHQLPACCYHSLPEHLTLLQCLQQTVPATTENHMIKKTTQFLFHGLNSPGTLSKNKLITPRCSVYVVWERYVLGTVFVHQDDSLDHLKELVVRHFNVSGQVPREVNHRNDGFDTLEFVPLIALHCQLVLMCWSKRRKYRFYVNDETELRFHDLGIIRSSHLFNYNSGRKL